MNYLLPTDFIISYVRNNKIDVDGLVTSPKRKGVEGSRSSFKENLQMKIGLLIFQNKQNIKETMRWLNICEVNIIKSPKYDVCYGISMSIGRGVFPF